MTDMMQINVREGTVQMFDATLGVGTRAALVAARIDDLRREAERERTAREAGVAARRTESLRVRLGHALTAAGGALVGDADARVSSGSRKPKAQAHAR